MRAWDKKKAYRLWIKQQIRAGRINQGDGTWIPLNESKTAHRSALMGHREGKRQ